MAKPIATFFSTDAGPLVSQDGSWFRSQCAEEVRPVSRIIPAHGHVRQSIDDDERRFPGCFRSRQAPLGAGANGHPRDFVEGEA